MPCPNSDATEELCHSNVPVVSVLYVFAGKHRKSDVGDHLQTMHNTGSIQLSILEVDCFAPIHMTLPPKSSGTRCSTKLEQRSSRW